MAMAMQRAGAGGSVAPCRSRIPSRGSAIVVRANFFSSRAGTATGGRITGRAPKLADPVDFDSVGFRFDPANNRWLRDDRFAGKFDQTLATPRSGTPYVV
ncbi:hypothetical protein PLESTM_000770100, partial [Pleodorina starrii]